MQPPSFSFFLFVIFYPEVALYVCFSSGIPKHQRAALRVRVDKETNNKVDPKEGALFNGFHRTSTMQQQLAAGINSSRLRSFRDAITFLFFLQADLATELSKLFLFESHNRGNGEADRTFKRQTRLTSSHKKVHLSMEFIVENPSETCLQPRGESNILSLVNFHDATTFFFCFPCHGGEAARTFLADSFGIPHSGTKRR